MKRDRSCERTFRFALIFALSVLAALLPSACARVHSSIDTVNIEDSGGIEDRGSAHGSAGTTMVSARDAGLVRARDASVILARDAGIDAGQVDCGSIMFGSRVGADGDLCKLELLPTVTVPNKLHLFVAEASAPDVRKEVALDLGWTIDADGSHVELSGALCRAVKDGQLIKLTFQVGCKGIPALDPADLGTPSEADAG